MKIYEKFKFNEKGELFYSHIPKKEHNEKVKNTFYFKS